MPVNTFKYYKKLGFRHDLIAGLSVFLVALPLCLGIALASGAPIYSGLLSGIIGGLLVSIISGSQLGVSGPAAGLSTVVAASIFSLGDYKLFLLSVIIAGVFQLILGSLKFGSIASYFPSAVIKGMLASIGLILIFKQIPIIIGYEQPDFWTNVFSGLINSENLSKGAIIISVCCFFIFIIFKSAPGFLKKIMPVSLLVVLFGTLISLSFVYFLPGLSLSGSQIVNIPDDIFASMVFPDVSKITSSVGIWKDGLIIGIIATLETLLSVEAVDKLDKHNRITPINRELIAQGAGNIACGLLGAIPITAVIVRGSANVDAGGKTKLSAFFHGLFLLSAILLVPGLLRKIPYASLAVVLLITGYNLTKPSLYKNMWSIGFKQFLPFIITIVAVLFTDLLIGVCIGLITSVYFIIQNNFKADYKISFSEINGIKTCYIKLNSNVTFLNKVKLRKALDQIPEYSSLIIDGSECNFIDYDILEVISEFNNKAHDRHISLELKKIEIVKFTSVH